MQQTFDAINAAMQKQTTARDNILRVLDNLQQASSQNMEIVDGFEQLFRS